MMVNGLATKGHSSRPAAAAANEWRFELPAHLEAAAPPEARGLARDQVRLLLSYYDDNRIYHAAFRQLPHFLTPGDVLVINTSGTMNAALPAAGVDGMPLRLHLSTRLPADLWSVEVRRPKDHSTEPFGEAQAGQQLLLPEGGVATLHTPYDSQQRAKENGRVRLWVATLQLPRSLDDYLARHGAPIRYSYVPQSWPSRYYQTVYASEVGSAEMPSAGRAFTAELITQLVAHGVHITPLVLHTGVASLEDHEPPYEEFYRVPAATAQLVNLARRAGRRVVAVGTTTVRALETVTDSHAITHPGEGWTDVVITPQRGIYAVDGLLTGLHEPRSSHLMLLEALAGHDHLQLAYAQALDKQYLWHEFGDMHLLLKKDAD